MPDVARIAAHVNDTLEGNEDQVDREDGKLESGDRVEETTLRN